MLPLVMNGRMIHPIVTQYSHIHISDARCKLGGRLGRGVDVLGGATAWTCTGLCTMTKK